MLDKQKFAEDNIGLLYSYFTKHKVHDEDMQASLGLAFWRAVLTYKEDKGFTFSTYAYKVLGGEMYTMIRNSQMQKRTLGEGEKIWHFEHITSTNEDDVEASGLIGDCDDSFERFECNDAVERLLPYLQPEEQGIVKLSYAGYKGVEIAKIMGCSRQNVSARQKRIHNFAKRQLWKEMMAD